MKIGGVLVLPLVTSCFEHDGQDEGLRPGLLPSTRKVILRYNFRI